MEPHHLRGTKKILVTNQKHIFLISLRAARFITGEKIDTNFSSTQHDIRETGIKTREPTSAIDVDQTHSFQKKKKRNNELHPSIIAPNRKRVEGELLSTNKPTNKSSKQSGSPTPIPIL